MQQNRSPSHEVVFPLASLTALRRALVERLGPDDAAAALQEAGYAAGDAFFAPLFDEVEAGAVGEHAFWRRLDRFFTSRGWGSVQHQDVHPGVGALESGDWAEARAVGRASRPSCFFSAGLLANLLGRAAGGEVAVLEVSCRSRGDDQCQFLFGGPDALNTLYTRLAAGENVEHSLAEMR